MLDGQRRALCIEVVARVAAVVEDTADEAVGLTRGELGIVDEATLGPLPVFGVPLAGGVGQRADVERRVQVLAVTEVALGGASRLRLIDRAVVLRAEAVAQPRRSPRA